MSESFTNKQKFDRDFIKLCSKYNLGIGVELRPANKLTKLLQKFIRVTWNLTVVDTKVEE